jgi:predicted RNA polymerase sigma factor
LPEFPEAFGLLALMLLHDSRRRARVDARGQLILLEEQDRSLWDRDAIVEKALSMGRPGPYQIQAAISSLHLPEWSSTIITRSIATPPRHPLPYKPSEHNPNGERVEHASCK